MKPTKPISIRLTTLLLFSTLFTLGCSSSNESSVDSSNGGSNPPTDPGSSETGTEDTIQTNLTATQITFDITVPVILSDALQVRLVWGDKDITANWIERQTWAATESFPLDTENLLAVTFSDDNGAITLASFETIFQTGSNEFGSFQITADQFDTDRWDSDSDSVSNIDELIAGSDPLLEDATDTNAPSEPLQSPQANLELVADKIFRLSWETVQGAQFYRVLENMDGVSGFNQISEDLNLSTQFYDHRVALYLSVGARYIVQACNANGCTDSDELLVSGTLEGGIAYLKSRFPDREDRLGSSVSISADGNTLAAGAVGESSSAVGVNGNQDDNSAESSGAAYVFARIDGVWQEQAYLKASNTDEDDEFGYTISLSADGNTLAVGTFKERSGATGINGDQSLNSSRFSGAVYMFTRDNGRWQQQAYLKPDRNYARALFGRNISLNADGNTLAVSAALGNCATTGVVADNSDTSSGVVYVFERNNHTWQQQACLESDDNSVPASFGGSQDLSANGDILAIGSISNEAPGSVYVFERSNGTWQQQDHLRADILGLHGSVGRSISISADGKILAMGARDEGSATTGVNGNQNDTSAQQSGAAYVFARINENWQQQAYIKASNTNIRDQFGYDVALSADGKSLAVHSRFERSASTGINGDQTATGNVRPWGAIYVFVQSGEGWRQQAFVKSPYEEYPQGGSIDLSADGTTLAVGASSDSGSSTTIGDLQDNTRFSGAVYLY